MIEIFGWFGAACFTLCGLPQALVCIRQGHGRGLSQAFLWLWFTGEISMLVYTIVQLKMDKPMMLNLSANIIFILIIFRYVYFPRKDAVQVV